VKIAVLTRETTAPTRPGELCEAIAKGGQVDVAILLGNFVALHPLRSFPYKLCRRERLRVFATTL